MPTYEYACSSCRRRVEAVQKFTDPPLTECPHCGGTLKRVFHPVGIVLKGSGFYATDNRGGKKTAAVPGEKGGEKSGEKSGEKRNEKGGDGGGTKDAAPAKGATADSKPAKTTPAPSGGSSGTSSS